MYQAIGLYQGKKITVSKQDHGTHWPLHLLILSLSCALLAGILGGLLGVGGGFVMGPLFIELGIAPQVFSSSIDTCDRRCIQCPNTTPTHFVTFSYSILSNYYGCRVVQIT
jgi:ABC-type antimicrobial peptide transport system permease subunit